MDDLYSYTDYRRFLKDYYESHKAKNPSFSYRYLANKAGVNSSAFFKFIIEGKRNLTKQSIIKIAAALRLTGNESEYFENLVFFNQAKTIKEKDLFFSRLMEHKKTRKVAPIGEEYYEYFAQWYHCVIRELIVMADFADDWERLGRLLKPRIGAKQAKQSAAMFKPSPSFPPATASARIRSSNSRSRCSSTRSSPSISPASGSGLIHRPPSAFRASSSRTSWR
jgi:uncharacterized protein (TIGR02147 family)